MPEVIRIMGGITAEPQHAKAGEMHLDRAPGEALEAFEGRAVAAAETAGAGFAIIGGLADSEQIAGAEAEADALAESILAAAEPEAHDCAAFVALIAFAERTGMFSISPRHMAALDLLRGAAEAGA